MKFKAHTRGINTIDFSPEGSYLASGGDDFLIKIWNLDEYYLKYMESSH